jgi:PAS domain S-box-containing protein
MFRRIRWRIAIPYVALILLVMLGLAVYLERDVAYLRPAILAAAALATLLAVLLALLIAERTAQPLRQLTHLAERLARGDLSGRLLPTTQDEVGQLAHAFNQMADQLQVKIATLTEERGRLAAVLEHMTDGVIITAGEGRVQLINPVAARLLGTTETIALGRSFAQVVRHHHLVAAHAQFVHGMKDADVGAHAGHLHHGRREPLEELVEPGAVEP